MKKITFFNFGNFVSIRNKIYFEIAFIAACLMMPIYLSAQTLTWNGAAGTTWSTSAASWFNGSSTVAWSANKDAVFNTAITTLMTSGTITCNSITVNQNVTCDKSGTPSFVGGATGEVCTINVASGKVFKFGNTPIKSTTTLVKEGAGELIPNSALEIIMNAGTIQGVATGSLGKTFTMHGGILTSNSTNKLATNTTTFNITGNITIGSATAANGSTANCGFTFDASEGGINLTNANRIVTLGGSGTQTFSGKITSTTPSLGALTITTTGSGKMLISNPANDYSGGTTINGGTLIFGATGVLADAGSLTLGGGTLQTGSTVGFSETIGTLALTDNSSIDLGTGVHNLVFANSSAISWTSGKTLTINGWTGTLGSSGTSGKIYIGANSNGLTSSQLSKIVFAGYAGVARMLSTGEVIPDYPSPPQITTATGANVDAAFEVTFTDDPTWRNAITEITVNGTSMTSGYTVSTGKITFTPSLSTLLQNSETKSIVIYATGYLNNSISQTISSGAPTKLAITTQPTAPDRNDGALMTQPVVQVQDQYGNLKTGSSASVVGSVASGTWTLGGTLTKNAVGGIVSFTGLTATALSAVTGATINFTSGSLTGVISNSFNIPAPSAAPVITTATGANVDAAFDVTFTDDLIWRSAIVDITVNGTSMTSGYTVSTGKITFTPSLSTLLQNSGTKSIVIFATGFLNNSISQNINSGAPAKLALTTQPTAPDRNGGALITQPAVQIQDQYGNLKTGSAASVVGNVGSGTWTLGGTFTINAVGGIATFTGLTATALSAVTGATINFTSGTLTGVTSNPFNIPAPSSAPIITTATGANVDAAFDVTFTDDLIWRSAIVDITVNGTSMTSGYTISTGKITFTPSLSTLLQNSGTKSIVIYATGYLNNTISQTISSGAPAKLALTTQPTTPDRNGGALITQPVVQIQDQYGNLKTGSSASVVGNVGSGTWTLGGTLTKNAVGGIVTYTGLTATALTAVNGATINFTSGALTGVTSNSFNIPTPSVAPVLSQANGASINSAFSVTFTENTNWQNAISNIQVNGTSLSSGYSISNGKITFDPQTATPSNLINTTGAKSITVIASGFLDATVTQNIGTGGALATDVLPVHPRLFFLSGEENALNIKINSNPIFNSIDSLIIVNADKATDTANPISLVSDNYLGTESDNTSTREAIQRILNLSYAYRMRNDIKYFNRAELELLGFANKAAWYQNYLQLAELITALSIGYDWLYDQLSASSRTTIANAIQTKGLEKMLLSANDRWKNTPNNGGQVGSAGFTFGATALFDLDKTKYAGYINTALNAIEVPMETYINNGDYKDGYMYWDYGTAYNVRMINALETAWKTDFGLYASPGFNRTADFMLHMEGPKTAFYNIPLSGPIENETPIIANQGFDYGDCASNIGSNPYMFWFAAKNNDKKLCKNEVSKLTKKLASDPGNLLSDDFLALLMTLLPIDAFDNHQDPDTLMYASNGEAAKTIMRSSWTDPRATYIAAKGGVLEYLHNHMDIGSFVLDADSVRWATELGSQSRSSFPADLDDSDTSQDGDHWKVFRYGITGHNTLIVNGENQLVTDSAGVVVKSTSRDSMSAEIDMSDLYSGTTNKLIRTFSLINKVVKIKDLISTKGAQDTICWNMCTTAIPEIVDNNTIYLRQTGKTLKMTLQGDVNAKSMVWTTVSPNSYDADNDGSVRVGFEIIVPANATDKSYVVTLEIDNTIPAAVKPVLSDDFEHFGLGLPTPLTGVCWKSNNSNTITTSVVPNPNRTGINTTSRVLKIEREQDSSATSTTRGVKTTSFDFSSANSKYVNFKFIKNVAGKLGVRIYYDGTNYKELTKTNTASPNWQTASFNFNGQFNGLQITDAAYMFIEVEKNTSPTTYQTNALTVYVDSVRFGSTSQNVKAVNTSVDITSEKDEIVTYYNKVTSTIELENLPESCIVRVNNMLGMECKRIKTNSIDTSINISNLSNGVYIVSCYNNSGKIYSGKVLKN